MHTGTWRSLAWCFWYETFVAVEGAPKTAVIKKTIRKKEREEGVARGKGEEGERKRREKREREVKEEAWESEPFPESFQVPNSSLVVSPGRVSMFLGIQNTITSAA